jgi:hypothetical protein
MPNLAKVAEKMEKYATKPKPMKEPMKKKAKK